MQRWRVPKFNRDKEAVQDELERCLDIEKEFSKWGVLKDVILMEYEDDKVEVILY